MSDEKRSRKDKFEKRRKNTKLISLLFVVIFILFISLLGMWLFGGSNEDNIAEELNEQQEEAVEVNKDNGSDENIENKSEPEENQTSAENDLSIDEKNEEKTDLDDNQNKDTEIKEVEPSDDNVIKAYEGNWDPVATKQKGPHTVTFADNSQDRLEMRKAILLATELEEDDYREWWLGNGGDQKVIATVSNNSQSEIYRVYLSWIDNEGLQPTKVEELKENDWEKYRSN